ncbi:metal ABC transporter permease [Marinobacterium stanieri]|uniref:metal ABC transporter permease n=1 Tax=Marinobacterium stanieri TaxID=49186 RepID=UPI003A919571
MLVELELLLPPLVAGLLVLCTHLPLGMQVLARGILFIDLAIAQLAALGSLLAQQMGAGSMLSIFCGMLLAILGALLVGRLAQRFSEYREALIGLLYVAAASVCLLVLTADPHGGQRLASSLNGDILWVSWPEMLPLALITPVFLLLWWRGGGRKDAVFYPAFALLVSLSVPLLGIYLVFVTLIAPALVAQLSQSRSWALAGAVCGYLAGLLLAWQLDWPAGATVVLALLVTSALVAWRVKRPEAAYSGGGGSGSSYG